jgi:glycosyltransferase involved in cell wall biosynthesis
VRAVQEQAPGYRERPSALGPLGVDVELFRPDPQAGQRVRAELGWSEPGPPVIGYVGRFVEEKGLRLLLRALEGLRPAWRALFLGGGALEPELRRFAAAQGDRVRIVSAAHDRVPAYMNAIDVLCAPSQTASHWREQFGRMAIEAFACGVPVVASDSGEIPYVVGDAGLVIGESDEVGFRAALAGLLEDPARRRELGARGLSRARDVYAWPHVARAHLDFIESLVDRRRASAGRDTRR